MQRLTVDLEKSATELPPKVFNPPFSNTCPGKDVILESAQQFLLDRQSIFGNDLISLPENSSLYVPSENMASYMSSVGAQGDIPLNLSSSTDNSQWFKLPRNTSLPPIQVSTGLNVKKQNWLRSSQESFFLCPFFFFLSRWKWSVVVVLPSLHLDFSVF